MIQAFLCIFFKFIPESISSSMFASCEHFETRVIVYCSQPLLHVVTLIWKAEFPKMFLDSSRYLCDIINLLHFGQDILQVYAYKMFSLRIEYG